MDDVFICLSNCNGYRALFSPFGARWISMFVPDKKGIFTDVILGFDDIYGYKSAKEKYHGAIVGRVCGRISNSSFYLDGKKYKLSSNDIYGTPIKNHLHGGIEGFHKKIWRYEVVYDKIKGQGVIFTYTSPDGEEGYPGEVKVSVEYYLTDDNSVEMEYSVVTNKKTYLNLTNHTFFNLEGYNGNNVMNHYLHLSNCKLIECDGNMLPTGKIIDVKGDTISFDGSMNLLDSIMCSKILNLTQPDVSLAYAIDNNDMNLPVAILSEPKSGRRLTIFTNNPSIQIYNAYFMDNSDIGKNNIALCKYAGIAIETQGFPDAPNRPEFPSILLSPGEIKKYKTIYKFESYD